MLQLKVTESLYLKELEESHAEELFAAIDQSRDHLRKWLPWVDRTRTVADTLSFLKNMEDQKHEHKGLAMGIFRKEQLVGSVDMHDWNHELNKAALGYWLVENCQQKGIMQVCVRKFMNYLFDQLSLNKIELQVVAENERSLKLAAGLGFKVEGVLRASYKMNGRLFDLVITGMLSSERA